MQHLIQPLDVIVALILKQQLVSKLNSHIYKFASTWVE
jgi:hypothetical protein